MWVTYIYITYVLCTLFADKSVLKLVAVSKNNLPVHYSILSAWKDAPEYFDIDPSTGLITTGGKSLDYEERSILRMQFRASESDRRVFSTCLVEINVIDLNDNTPTFGTETYHGRIPENSPPNTAVLRVNAVDADTVPAGKGITYAIVPGMRYSPYFTIDPVTGIIRTKVTMDTEHIGQEKEFTLHFSASDGENPSRTSSADITLVDDNDNDPFYSLTDYSFSVREDVPMLYIVHSFTAKDNDIGLNARLKFYISDGNQAHAFHLINVFSPKNEGQLLVEDRLDYETTKEYQLQIIATDGRSSSYPPANVIIKVRTFYQERKYEIQTFSVSHGGQPEVECSRF